MQRKDPEMTAATALTIARPRTADEFAAIFTAHYAAVYRLAYRIAGTREEADDLAQEAFLRLHRATNLWQGGEAHNVAGWLYRVTTHLALNALRSDERRGRREQGGWVIASPAPDPADAAVRADERAIVRRALARLPQRQAQLLLLRHAGLSYRELAAALDLAPGSVGTLLARAEAAFARAYEGGDT